MTAADVRLDHLLTYVPSLDDAATLFTKLGFTLSPRSTIDAMGISNHLILMSPAGPGRANYLELMSPHDRRKLAPTMQQVLSGPAGTRSMVLAAEAIGKFHRRMGELGFIAPEPVHARREWKIPGEASVFPEFDVILPVAAPLRFNACRYYNVELYLRPEWRVHANGAKRVASCFAIADEPESLSSYATLFGQPARRSGEGGWRFPTGEIDLQVMTPAAAQRRFNLETLPSARPAYLGYEVEVASLDRLRACLRANDVAFRSTNDAVSVAPEIAFGNLIWFTEGGAS